MKGRSRCHRRRCPAPAGNQTPYAHRGPWNHQGISCATQGSQAKRLAVCSSSFGYEQRPKGLLLAAFNPFCMELSAPVVATPRLAQVAALAGEDAVRVLLKHRVDLPTCSKAEASF